MEDLYTLDWCYTQGNCGQWHWGYGYWDHCQYKAEDEPSFNNLSWQQKQAQVWNLIKSDSRLGSSYPSDAFTESVVTTFENEHDYLTVGRRKAIHGIGAVCQFHLEIPSSSPFTGILKAGSLNSGLIRMGSATDSLDEMTPGVSIKFFRTGIMSANVLLLNSLLPLPENSFDFFSVPLSNHIQPGNLNFQLKILAQKFCQPGHCITKVGLSNLATHDQQGKKQSQVNFPFKLVFVPSGQVSMSNAKPKNMDEFMARFKSIGAGTKLYSIKAYANPNDGQGMDLGSLVIGDGGCVSSKYGDTKLAFKHQWIEEDAKLKPQWTAAYLKDCYCNGQ